MWIRPKTMIQRGFSLIEMTAVLFLLALLIGVTIPAVSNIDRFRATTEMGRFNAFLRSMLMKSIRNNTYIRVMIDLNGNRYWAEKSDTPFFLMTSAEADVRQKEQQQLIEDIENTPDPFSDRTGAASGAANFMQMIQAKEDEAATEEFYQWENFVPSPRDVKKMLTPEFERYTEPHTLPEGVRWKSFFSYHTPDIVRPELMTPQDEEQLIMAIHIFPQGRVEPFFLSVGGEEAEPVAYIESDFFLNTSVSPGDFTEKVAGFREQFTYGEEEGK